MITTLHQLFTCLRIVTCGVLIFLVGFKAGKIAATISSNTKKEVSSVNIENNIETNNLITYKLTKHHTGYSISYKSIYTNNITIPPPDIYLQPAV